MSSYLNEAGPLIWPVLALCLAALLSATLYAMQQRGRQAALALGAAVAALIVALLGAILGFQKSVAGLGSAAAEKGWLVLFGLDESLNGVVLALVAAFLVAALLTAGAWRRGAASAA